MNSRYQTERSDNVHRLFLFLAMSNVFFTCTSLAGTEKKGILTPDADGYYTQPIGGLDVHNSAGHFYTAEPAALKLFEGSSSFMRRVQRGALRGEVDHPLQSYIDPQTKQYVNLTDDEYTVRMLTIDPRNVCVHWAGIGLDSKNYKDADGRPMTAIIGKFKPSGPQAEFLERQLRNPHENVCFSIRAFTLDRFENLKRKRCLAEIVTFDYVNEPGIATAEKYKSLSLERQVDRPIHQGSLERAVERQTLYLGKESVTVDVNALKRSFGWDAAEKRTPGFFGWKK